MLGLLREEQARLSRELSAAQQRAKINHDSNSIDANLTYDMALAADFQQAYPRGGPRTRRSYNQTLVEAKYVDFDAIAGTRLARPFDNGNENPDPHNKGQG